MADGLFGGAAFGVYPQMQPRRRLQDVQGSANLPVDVLRGRIAGLFGLVPDVLNFMGRSPMPTETFGETQYDPRPQLPYDTDFYLKNLPLAPTSRAGEVAGLAGSFVPLNPMPAARLAGRGVMATKGLPVGASIKNINLGEGIFKPEITMQEMLRVRDIPTVERVQRSIDLVGEKKFQEMVESQFKQYKPTNQTQEAMLVESVTLDILGKANRDPELLRGLPGLKIPAPQQAALDLAQQRAALPVEQGGLGLPANNTAMDRARALNYPMGKSTSEPSYEAGHSDIGIFNRFKDQPKTPLKNAEKIKAEFEQMGIPVTAEQASTGTVYLKFPGNPYSIAPEYGGGQSVPIETLRFSTHSKREFGKPTNEPDLDSFVADVFPKGGNTLDEARQAINELIKQGGMRSRFAAFDPFRRSAAVAATMGVAAPDLLASPIYTDPFGNTIADTTR